MDPHLIDHVTFVLAILIAGALIAVIVGVPLFVAGRRSKDPGGLQARVTAREQGQARKAAEAQLAAVKRAVEDMKMHHQTAPHDVLYLEEHIDPLLTKRSLPEDPPRPWWRRLSGIG